MTAKRSHPKRDNSFSIGELLRSMDVDVKQIEIVSDNARFHATSASSSFNSNNNNFLFNQSMVTNGSLHDSCTTFDSSGEDDFTTATDFDLPIWELDANTDSRWGDSIEVSHKMMSPPRRSSSSMQSKQQLPTSLRQLPFKPKRSSGSSSISEEEGRTTSRDIALLIDESLTISNSSSTEELFSSSSSSSSLPSPPKRRSRQPRPAGAPRGGSSPKDNARLRKQCERMSLVF